MTPTRTFSHRPALLLFLAFALALLGGCLAHAQQYVVSWQVAPGATLNGATGYSVWYQPTNAVDKNRWTWTIGVNGITNTSAKLPVGVPDKVWLAVTTDRGGESSPYSAPVLLDTNALNRLVPLAAPAKINVTIQP